MGLLAELSDDIARITAQLAPSIVQVDGGRGRPATGIVWDADFVLTADHVIADEDAIAVGQPSSMRKATLVGRDPATDLALLQSAGLAVDRAARGRLADVRPGQLVLALGNAGERQVTLGIVSGVSGRYRSWRGAESESLIQTTAELLPGFSGGPLVGADGRVIGINSWQFGRGIPRALPVDTAEATVKSLRAHGRIRRPYVGIGAQPVTLPDGVRKQLGQDTGMLVVTIESGGPAAAAGVLQGDIIVAVDGHSVGQLDELFGALAGLQVGSSHQLRMVRAGELVERAVTLGERTP